MGVRFGDCELSVERIELRRGGEIIDVEPQVFDVLAYLLRHRERVVPKTELLDQIWGNRFVSESALSSRIKSARRAVGVREFLVVAAEQSGAVLLLDDLHLAHREAVLLVEDVARLTRGHRVAVIIAQRPDAQRWPGFDVVELADSHQPQVDQHAIVDLSAEVARLVELGAAPAHVADLLLTGGEPAMAAPFALEAARIAAASGLYAEVLRLLW